MPSSHTGAALRAQQRAAALCRRAALPAVRDAVTRASRQPQRAARRSACAARASTTCAISSVDVPRERFTVITGVSGSGQIDAGLRHPVPRGPAPLSRVTQRLRAPIRAAGGAPRRRLHQRAAADGGHRAARQPRRTQEHGGDAHRDLPFPAAHVREAGGAALSGLRYRDRAAEPRAHRDAARARATADAASSCWRP